MILCRALIQEEREYDWATEIFDRLQKAGLQGPSQEEGIKQCNVGEQEIYYETRDVHKYILAVNDDSISA